MAEFTIELDDMVCKWLQHISSLTGKTIEQTIQDAICNQILVLEDDVQKVFTYNEQH